MTSICSADGGSIWIKFRRLVQNNMSTAVMWSKSKPDVEFQCGGRFREFHSMSSQSHLPHCRVLPPGELNGMSSQSHVLHGAATWWIHCHDSRATCNIAGCSHLTKSMSWSCHIAKCVNFIRHTKNRFSPYFIFFCFLMQFGLWRATAFVSSPIHLLYDATDMLLWMLSTYDVTTSGQHGSQQNSVSESCSQRSRPRITTAAVQLSSSVQEARQRTRSVEKPVPTVSRHHSRCW